MTELLSAPAPTLVVVDLAATVRYQGASGDFNPLHHDPAFAAAAGYDRPVAVGMHLAGLMSTWLTGWCDPDDVRRFAVRFRAPVLVGDAVRVGGEVVERRWAEDGERLVVSLWCRRVDDEATAVTGEAECLVTDGRTS
ncbi:acyl dehydratase [Nocardioides marinisabuli]|uniref:Acyl dehydratase n=1 Tax=Nocardioides marinisabuli TaxID=419476 RepID=A0A7Y9F2N5_9ACTN|nr:MaoC family dehydratase [Nocardioides marinisabuli]NYD57605.1 acyl dehydratase [Nocardioides marinisabuli]